MKSECKRCHSGAVMPNSGICLSCGLKNDHGGGKSGCSPQDRRPEAENYRTQLQMLRQKMGVNVDDSFRQELTEWACALGSDRNSSAREG